MKRGDLQAFVHVLKRLARLFEEIVDYRFAEFALLLVVVHFENLSPGSRISLWHLCSAFTKGLRTHLLEGRLVDQIAKVIDCDNLVRLLVVDTISTTATIKSANVNAGVFRNGIAVELRPAQRRAALELAPCGRYSVEVDAHALLFLPKKSSRRSRAAYFLIRCRHDGFCCDKQW